MSTWAGLGYVVVEGEEVEVASACDSLAREFGITAAAVAQNWDILQSLKENAVTAVCAAGLRSTAFREFVSKQRSSSKGKTTLGKQPFGSTWDNMSNQEVSLLNPTPKRQAVAGKGSAGPSPASAFGPAPTTAATPPRSRAAPVTSGIGTPLGGARQGQLTSSLTPPATNTKFGQRIGRDDRVCVLHEDVPLLEPGQHSTAGAPQLLGEPLPPVGQHLFMMETLEAKVQATEERLLDWADWLQQAMPAGSGCDPHRQSVSQVTQESVWAVGRIVVDVSSEEAKGGRLTLANLQLEGSREASNGARVRLNVSALQAAGKGVRLFPGQVVGVQGLNPTGSEFVVQHICAALPPSAPESENTDLGVNLIVAAGPFTTTDDLSFQPLDDLLELCARKQPDVVLLTGPWLDVDHPLIKTGALPCTFETAFHQVVQRIVVWQAAHPRTRVLLQPSARDAHHAPVFPTPPFSLPGAPDALSSVPNPAMLSLPGALTLGVVATDVLRALSGAELSVGSGGPERLPALAAQLVGQRSFFPLYPAPLGTCLDLTGLSHLAMHVTPHLLVVPSDLAPFAKLVSMDASVPKAEETGPTTPNGGGASSSSSHGQRAVLCVNPGRLVRGAAGGTYAQVCVQPAEAGRQSSVVSRCRVEVRRV